VIYVYRQSSASMAALATLYAAHSDMTGYSIDPYELAAMAREDARRPYSAPLIRAPDGQGTLRHRVMNMASEPLTHSAQDLGSCKH
jgi:hypothetical protein